MPPIRTALDADDNGLDQAERAFVAKVREHGWMRMGVFGDAEGPGFSYSTGFWLNAGAPELIMFGTKNETVHDVFWEIYHEAIAGRPLIERERTHRVLANLAAYAFPVARRHYPEFLGWTRWFYAGDDFPCLQIVWPDRAGVFPWERGFDEAFASDQPDLTENGWLAEIAD